MAGFTLKKVHKWPYVALIVGALVASTVLTVLRPQTNSNPMHYSQLVIVVLSISIIVPYLAAWILGVMSLYSFRGVVHVGTRKRWVYTDGFRFITYGIALLVADLIGSALLSSVRNAFINNFRLEMYITIGANLFHVLVPLVAFLCMLRGLKLLLNIGGYGQHFQDKQLPVLLPAAAFTAFFSLLVFTSPMRQFSGQLSQPATYFLPDVLIGLLVVLPLVITWAISLRVILDTERFLHSLPHNMRHTLIKFLYGLTAVISGSIIVQGITALGSQRLQSIGIVFALLLIYIFLALQALAYGFLYRSGRDLYKFVSELSDETD